MAMAAGIALYWLTGFLTIARGVYDPPLEDDRGTLWLLRGAIAAVAAINFATAAYLTRNVVQAPQASADTTRLRDRLLSSTLAAGALAEAVGIYGLLLTLLGGEPWDMLVAGGAALAALAILFPRRAKWDKRAREAATR